MTSANCRRLQPRQAKTTPKLRRTPHRHTPSRRRASVFLPSTSSPNHHVTYIFSSLRRQRSCALPKLSLFHPEDDGNPRRMTPIRIGRQKQAHQRVWDHRWNGCIGTNGYFLARRETSQLVALLFSSSISSLLTFSCRQETSDRSAGEKRHEQDKSTNIKRL